GPHPVALLADVHVKHASPLGETDVARAAADTFERGLADGLILSGAATGAAPEVAPLEAVRRALPDAPLLLGSGLRPEACPTLAPRCDGAIVGSAAQLDGHAGNPIDPARARAVVAAFRAARR